MAFLTKSGNLKKELRKNKKKIKSNPYEKFTPAIKKKREVKEDGRPSEQSKGI